MITIKKRILALAAAVLILFGSVFAATAFDGNDYDYGGGGDDCAPCLPVLFLFLSLL